MFLEHKISKDLVRMDERKVKEILDWPRPKLVSKLRSFVGLADYYRKFIRVYSRKVASLTDLSKMIKSGHGMPYGKRNLRTTRLWWPQNLSYDYQNSISLSKCIPTPLIKRSVGCWYKKDTLLL